jgi:Beta-propeller repeat
MYPSSRFAWLACAGVLCAATPDTTVSQAKAVMARLPLRFEENRGQASPSARYLARAAGYSLELTARGPALALGGKRIELTLPHSNPAPAIVPEQRMPARTNYFIGRRDQWRTGIANYARIRYRDVYPGIDAVYYGTENQMEYDFVVAPGADPRAIRLQWTGADRVSINHDGDLSVEAGGQPILQKRPRVYQEGREIAARYTLHGRNEARVELGAYDRTKPLVIDPILIYCTYFGSSGNDQVTAMKMGPKGMLYVTGSTTTAEMPALDGAYNLTNTGLTDIFIAVLDATQPTCPLVYFTYLGGTNLDIPLAMAVDPQGVVYLTGTTTSTDFPLAGTNASTGGVSSSVDAFVTKLDPSLSGTDGLLYSTYLGGTGNDSGNGIALDRDNKIYVIGTTKSTDFPVTDSAYAGVLYGSQDAFISKIDPDASTTLIYSTYMGGELNDDGRAIAVGSNGLVYFAASTNSTLFPMEGAGYRQSLQGAVNLAIGVLDMSQSGAASMRYSTYFGGSGVEEVRRMALDANNNVVLTGYTLSTDFPTTAGALSRVPLGNADIFVSIVNPLNPSGFLVYSTYFGGSQGEVAYDVLPDSSGNLYLTGYTLSPDLYTVDAPQPGWGGGIDLFVAKIKPGTAGRAGVLFSTYFGTLGQYVGNAVTLGTDGSVYSAGYGNRGLPANGNGFSGGNNDGFLLVVK